MQWLDQDDVLALLASWERNQVIGKTVVCASVHTPYSSEPQSESSDSTVTTTTTLAQPASSAVRGRSINVSRERRRQEALSLRKKVQTLEHKLSELQQRRVDMLQPHFRDSQMTQIATVAPVWEHLSRRQFQAWKRSLRRNAELKALLAAQLRVAEALCQVHQRALDERKGTPLTQLSLPDCSQGQSPIDHLAQLAGLCAQWPTVLAATPQFHDSSTLDFFKMDQVDGHDGRESVVSVTTCNAVPFSVDEVEAALWSVATTHSLEADDADTHRETLVATDDTVVSEMTTVATLVGGCQGTIRGQRAHMKADARTATQRLLVTHSAARLAGFHNSLDGATVRVDSWVRLVDARSGGHTQLKSPLTVVQHLQRTTLTSSAHNDQAQAQALSTLSALYTERIKSEVEWMQEALEDTLMAGSSVVQ